MARRSKTPAAVPESKTAPPPPQQSQSQQSRRSQPSSDAAQPLASSASNSSLSIKYRSQDSSQTHSNSKRNSGQASTDTVRAGDATVSSSSVPYPHDDGHGHPSSTSSNQQRHKKQQRGHYPYGSSSQSHPQQTQAPSTSSSSKKFTLRSKKKRLEEEAQEREEQRLKQEADEAIRRKHGEYHPPGQSQGQIHTHRNPRQPPTDHYVIERSGSHTSLRQQYQQRHNSSSSRVASPTPRTQQSIESMRYHYQRGRSTTPSSASSSAASSRHNSYHRESDTDDVSVATANYHIRIAKTKGGIRQGPPMAMNDLESLDAEGMLSDCWDSQSDHDPDLETYGPIRNHQPRRSEGGGHFLEQERRPSTDTNSSLQSGRSSSAQYINSNPIDRLLSPSSTSNSSSRQSRSTYDIIMDARRANSGMIGLGLSTHAQYLQQYGSEQQSRTDSRLSTHRGLRALEMTETKPQHQSWPLNNNHSTTGIVTGLDPALVAPAPAVLSSHLHHHHHAHHHQHHDGVGSFRSVSSQGRYMNSSTPSRDNMVERYFYHARANSPANSNVASSSNHRTSSSGNNHPRLYHPDPHRPDSRFSHHHTSIDMAAVDSLRAKSGSRASRIQGGSPSTIQTSNAGTVTAVATPTGTAIGSGSRQLSHQKGMGDSWSVKETEVVLPDEHNYLAPLPPFQAGPAYTRVPKRRFCRWWFGGCRWWVLMILMFLPPLAAAIVVITIKHYWPKM
ncbi:hypothetical protein BGZ83_008695 [Gryganskiella cystojenkinii]|nr:hypothetical protein BGZ83_008695 [Gryganskiella cystojenkinii]